MLIQPLPSHLGFCAVVPDFLSAVECEEFITRSESLGFRSAGTDYPPSYRNNERTVVDDHALAQQMTEHLRGCLPQETFVLDDDDSDAGSWTLDGVNERFRFCRYRESQAFHIHQDGVHHRGDGVKSRLTFMIYLTDGDEFEGGDTLFFAAGPHTAATGEQHPPVVARVRPRAGSLIVFDHKIWHAGDVVTRGVKHIMRSDVLYRRDALKPHRSVDHAAFEPPHAGYVWTLCALSGGKLASGGRDAVVRLWTNDGRSLHCMHGHDQSVLGLAELPDGRLASVSRDRTLRVWDVDTGACERISSPHDAAILCVAALNEHIATGSADGSICLTELATGEETTLARGLGWIWGLAASRAGTLAAASEDGCVRTWITSNTGRLQATGSIAGEVPLRTLALSEDGNRLATGDIAGTVKLWLREGGHWTLVAAWQAHAAAVRRVRFFDDGRLASGGEDGVARIWLTPFGTWAWQAEHCNFVTDVLPLGETTVLSCAYDGRIARHET